MADHDKDNEPASGAQKGAVAGIFTFPADAAAQGAESVMRHFRASLREHDLTEQQWRILRALMNVPDIEVTDLARATFLLGPSLSRILRDLEARTLIERRQDSRDLRRARIAISAAGLAVIERVSPQSEAIYQRITEAFGADRMRDLLQLLEDLEVAMAEIGPVSDEGDADQV